VRKLPTPKEGTQWPFQASVANIGRQTKCGLGKRSRRREKSEKRGEKRRLNRKEVKVYSISRGRDVSQKNRGSLEGGEDDEKELMVEDFSKQKKE